MFIVRAFFTLIKEQILCIFHVCKGPNYVGFLGILQPFSYFLKLVSYYYLNSRYKNKYLFFFSPFARLLISVFLWALCPFICMARFVDISVIIIIIILGLGVFPVLICGWGSNNKYTLIGSLRNVSQVVSYEVTLSFFFIIFFF